MPSPAKDPHVDEDHPGLDAGSRRRTGPRTVTAGCGREGNSWSPTKTPPKNKEAATTRKPPPPSEPGLRWHAVGWPRPALFFPPGTAQEVRLMLRDIFFFSYPRSHPKDCLPSSSFFFRTSLRPQLLLISWAGDQAWYGAGGATGPGAGLRAWVATKPGPGKRIASSSFSASPTKPGPPPRCSRGS